MKFRFLKSLLIAILCLIANFLPLAAPIYSANEPISLSNVTLWIYPEYDDPRLLVMLEGQIAPSNSPVQIRFLVPTDAEMYSAGSKDSQGKYQGGPPDRQLSSLSGWDEISYTLKSGVFRMEYYDPVISSTPNKTFSYEFRSLYPISNLQIIVQQPTGATQFSVVPAGVKTNEGSFTIYSYQYPSLSPGEPLHFDISYVKTDSNPSFLKSTDNSSSNSNRTIIILSVSIILGAIIVAAAVVWALGARRKAIPAGSKSIGPNINSKLRSKYCSQCGKRLEYPSKFCPYCRHKIDS